MNKFFASFVKEILLLIRDRAGIISLFVMPIILVFVMTIIEDSALNSIPTNKSRCYSPTPKTTAWELP